VLIAKCYWRDKRGVEIWGVRERVDTVVRNEKEKDHLENIDVDVSILP
jgi:hypothetical protein